MQLFLNHHPSYPHTTKDSRIQQASSSFSFPAFRQKVSPLPLLFTCAPLREAQPWLKGRDPPPIQSPGKKKKKREKSYDIPSDVTHAFLRH
jgi:hypothetical protein